MIRKGDITTMFMTVLKTFGVITLITLVAVGLIATALLAWDFIWDVLGVR